MNEMTKVEQIQTGDDLERCPFPVPYGWFCVHYSHELKKGEIKIEHCFGKDWVGDGAYGRDHSLGFNELGLGSPARGGNRDSRVSHSNACYSLSAG